MWEKQSQGSIHQYFSSGTPAAPPPGEKHSDSEDDVQNSFQAKKQLFLPSWLGEFPWLIVTESDNVMTCDFCKSTGKSNPFTKGSKNWQKLALNRHQSSKDHVNSIRDMKLKASFERSMENVKKSTESARSEMDKRHVVQLRNLVEYNIIGDPQLCQWDPQNKPMGVPRTLEYKTLGKSLQL